MNLTLLIGLAIGAVAVGGYYTACGVGFTDNRAALVGQQVTLIAGATAGVPH